MTILTDFVNVVFLISEETSDRLDLSTLDPGEAIFATTYYITLIDCGTLDPLGDLHHLPVFGKLNITKYRTPTITREVWHYNNADLVGLNNAIQESDWSILTECVSVDTATQFLTKHLIYTAKQHIPVRNIKFRSKDKPWFSTSVRKLIRIRNRWCGTYNRTKNPVHKIMRNIYRSRVKNEMRRLKMQYFDKQMQKLNDPELSNKKYWNIVKQLFGNKIKKSIPTLIDNNIHYTSDHEKATLLNDFFVEQSTLPDPTPDFQLPAFNYLTDKRLEQIEVTPFQVSQVMHKLPTNKASGPDYIANKLLKITSDTLCYPLATLFNKSLSQTIYPVDWKISNVSAIFKRDIDVLKNNYRPISLLCCMSKVFERLVFNEMYAYFMENGLLTPRNSGFKKLDSTVNQLIHIIHKIHQGLEEHNDVCMTFLDISKAFDKVYHAGLLHKLRQIGIEGNLLQWIKSYLTGRQQRVVINGVSSEFKSTNAGVPQGSILGPLFFLVFINDIVVDINSEIFIFADDTSIMRQIKNPIMDFEILNQDLNTLNNWAIRWRANFNAVKTEYMIFTNKHQTPHYPDLYLGNTIIKQVNEHTHLGLTLDKKLTWKPHINRICTKASQRITDIKRIRHLIPKTTAINLYRTLSRPILEYCDVIFDNTTKEMKKLIDQVQREALIMITLGYQRTATENLYKETGLEPLNDRRQNHRLIIFYKIMHGLTPDYLVNIVSHNNLPTHNYGLRSLSNNIIQIPFARTTRFANSYIPKTTHDWNCLNNDLKEAPSLFCFKQKLKKNIKYKPSELFTYFNGRASVHHCRMRMGLSALKSHLFKLNVTESPICELCGIEAEDTAHYFLRCPLFHIQRTKLLSNMCEVLPFNILSQLITPQIVNVLLQGHIECSLHVNCILFDHVLNYIETTKRFT